MKRWISVKERYGEKRVYSLDQIHNIRFLILNNEPVIRPFNLEDGYTDIIHFQEVTSNDDFIQNEIDELITKYEEEYKKK